MKKLLPLILLFSIKLATAQDTRMVKFGAKLVGGSSTVGSSYYLNPETAITSTNTLGAGFFIDYSITDKFYLQPGISVLNKGYATIELVAYLDGQNNYYANSTVTYYKPVYIEIPVNAVLKLPLGKGNVRLGGGPYFAYAVGGKVKEVKMTTDNSDTVNKEKIKIGNSVSDDYTAIDYGLNFFVGYQFRKGFFLEFSVAPGLANIIPKEQRMYDSKAINATALLNLGFEF